MSSRFALPLACILVLSGCGQPTTPNTLDPSKDSAETEPQQKANTAHQPTPSENLIDDPSLENTALGRLPRGWSTYLTDGPGSRCQVVDGGHSGEHCLQIEGKGTRAVVFTNGVDLDRTKRYALKGWAKFEGDQDARAIIKFNYFHNSEWLGANDLIGVSSNQDGWRLLEKTDAADDYPEASKIWVSCNIEGEGTASFDDLELVSYDREDLPADFDSQRGKDNLSSRLLLLNRWIGQWEAKTSPEANETAGTSNMATILDDRILQSHRVSEDGAEEALSLLTYDQALAEYKLWSFRAGGEAQGFAGQWDDASNTMTLYATRSDSDAEGTRITRFLDADTMETSEIVKDAAGVVTRDTSETLKRTSKSPSEITFTSEAATSPQEMKVLERLLGTWDVEQTTAVPEPSEDKGVVKREVVLGGPFIRETGGFSEEGEPDYIAMYTYDAKNHAYRNWFLHSSGTYWEATGTWNDGSQTLTFSYDTPWGGKGTNTIRLLDESTYEFLMIMKDVGGKVGYRSEGKAVRKK